MTEKELKKLSRADLLEMLIDQSTQLQSTQQRLEAAEAALRNRAITLDQSGSIAEAALRLNGVYEAAEAACRQYTDSIRLLSERQEAVCQRMNQDALRKAEEYQAETERRGEKMEADTKLRCAEMVAKAKAESQQYWNDVSAKLEAFYNEHAGLRELLSVAHPKINSL